IAVLPRPVTKMNCSMPAACASSTAYWISGLSTTGSISFGIALVAGRKRVPRPATGNTALRTGVLTRVPFGRCGNCRAPGERSDSSVGSPRRARPYTARLALEASPDRSCPQEDILGTVNLRRERVGAALIGMDLQHEAVMRL